MSGSTGALRADVIVVAAGGSTRMGGRDKLAVEIGGRPLLAWTLDALVAAPEVDRIVVVTAADRRATISAAAWLPGKVVGVVGGGARRQESVRAGFDALDGGQQDPAAVVLVHDAARPLVPPELVGAVAAATAEHGAAIPVVPVAETLKKVDAGIVRTTVDRTGLGAAQTPQGVRRDLLREAYRRFPADGPDTFTDEAALLEACSIEVHVVPGDPGNLKVTLPGDLERVARVLAPPAAARTGIGHDSHPFGPGMPLRLGGIEIAGAPRLAGHSDGDVVLHALADALLGAAGLGDLGRLFPADARTPTGIASVRLLDEVRRRLAAAGWRAAAVDVTIVAARPRLGDQLGAMRAAIATLLELEPAAVNVKASSGNLDGAEGGGRSISTLAVATIEASR
ncbi:MAG TPA: 2-C-methyl-D-erythritol 4-phosphate cytidylyltransferase [Candidatus Limnocylindrales bacterium]|nr:2-C-methyl-D-erythritol 4-phosphate cytidylyltransferase [Candidatus Limnocylindrales bacterium]